jgi:hypothetical protein
MAFDNNTYINKSLNSGSPYKRGYTFPLDCTELFLSLEDAEKYAMGDPTNPDERRLYRSAYAGQMIGVKTGALETDETKGEYDIYIIQGDGTLKKAGDTEYHPNNELEEAKTVEIGGIPNGLTGSSLEGKSISEIIDLLLFPTYIPRYYNSSIGFNLLYKSNNATANNTAIKIGTNIDLDDPDCVIKIGSKSHSSPYTAAGSANANKAFASSPTESWSETPNSSVIGKKSYTLTVNYSDGTTPIKNSKGQNIAKDKAEYSTNSFTTLEGKGTAAGNKFKAVYIQNEDETETFDKYVIPACTLSLTRYIYIVYPYYVPKSIDGEGNIIEDEIVMKDNAGNITINRTYNAKINKTMMYIDLPSTVNGETVEIRMKTFTPQGEETYGPPLTLLERTEIIKNINNKDYTYYRYQVDKSEFGDEENGQADYKITFTAPTN